MTATAMIQLSEPKSTATGAASSGRVPAVQPGARLLILVEGSGEMKGSDVLTLRWQGSGLIYTVSELRRVDQGYLPGPRLTVSDGTGAGGGRAIGLGRRNLYRGAGCVYLSLARNATAARDERPGD
jgi:hypothetical protein